MKHTIDAQGRKIGRVASEAASILIGKNSTSFARNKVLDVNVEIINTSKTDINAKKKLDKKYVTYTGHRGGLNTETLGHLMESKGAGEAIKRAVYNMLPANKLRNERMKRLAVKK